MKRPCFVDDVVRTTLLTVPLGIAASSLSCAFGADSGPRRTVYASRDGHVRTQPHASAAAGPLVPRGQKMFLLAHDGGWFKIQLPGDTTTYYFPEGEVVNFGPSAGQDGKWTPPTPTQGQPNAQPEER